MKTSQIEGKKSGISQPTAIPEVAAGMAAECGARALLYRLLSAVFVEEASAEFLSAMRTPEMLEQLAEVGIGFDADFTAAPLAELVDTLAVEYASLFAASGGFPPVESVRLYGRYRHEPNFEVMQTYQRLGFVLQPGRHEVFADQLGVELMFIAELLERQAEALAKGDLIASRKLEKEIKRFWSRHLGRWVRGYARLIERAAMHSFYREMARFLRGFAEEEIAALGLHIEDADGARLEVPKAEVQEAADPQKPGCTSDAAPPGRQGIRRLQDLRLPSVPD